MIKKIVHGVLWAVCSFALQAAVLERIEPANWWVGMQHPEVELMLYGKHISDAIVVVEAPSVRITRVTRTENPNYLFVRLGIDPAAGPMNVPLVIKDKSGKTLHTHSYPLLARRTGSAQRQGFSSRDAIYLLTPDRFANADMTNDSHVDMLERADRRNDQGRHGGDLQGMINALPYIKSLGFTAIWPTPLTENNQPAYSYHGYAATDLYRIDARFGGNEQYLAFVQHANAMGIKVIQDIILNHIGHNHWWLRDLPDTDWLNFQSEFEQGQFVGTNHSRTTIQDPHASARDRELFTDGWFVDTMPDLNQRHPLLATYLIQNSIWWIEYANLSGIREDTYSYADRDFLSEWARRIMLEYPQFNIVGEEWSANPAVVAYWQAGKKNADGYRSYTPAMLDFPVYDALISALTHKDDWNSGWIRLYETLANDHLYANPFNLVTFEGNHDTGRLFAVLGEDEQLFRMALGFLATMRGIPQMFYGTELAMTSPPYRDDGKVRADFPGGWPGDNANGFTGQGLSPLQKRSQDFVKKLFTWRKSAKAIHYGKLMHFSPSQGLYSYVRYTPEQQVLVLLNKNDTPQNIAWDRYREVIPQGARAVNVLTGQALSTLTPIEIAPRSVTIIELASDL